MAEHFRHTALFYSGLDDYVRRTSAFLREGIAAGEPALVVIAPEKAALLRRELGADAAAVVFADMNEVGRNPARIIPAWQDFVDEHLTADRPVRGIGEPIWAERSEEELVECERHESLLNLAFAGSHHWHLLCPYDTDALPEPVLEEARRNHPQLIEAGTQQASAVCRDLEDIARPFDARLAPAPLTASSFHLKPGLLSELRRFVTLGSEREGLAGRTSSFALAVHELATNSLRHGGGNADVLLWGTTSSVICEVRDTGRIVDPLVGRVRPDNDREGGWGVWMANQLCDLVQVRVGPAGTVVRVHMTKPKPIVICRTVWGEVRLDERQYQRVFDGLWRLGVSVPGAATAATKLAEARRAGRTAVELDERESPALERALLAR
jgi:anti-sigma regulatory factor (Ser/Thr protein kinase)